MECRPLETYFSKRAFGSFSGETSENPHTSVKNGALLVLRQNRRANPALRASRSMNSAIRGAARVTFAETDRAALAALRRNIERVKKAAASAGADFSARIVPCDCVKSAALFEGARYDIVFADPPYSMLCDPKTAVKIFSMFCKISRGDMFFVLEAPADFSLESAPKPFAFDFEQMRRLGRKSAGKPSQIVFKIRAK